jgi:hypothetical protein
MLNTVAKNPIYISLTPPNPSNPPNQSNPPNPSNPSNPSNPPNQSSKQKEIININKLNEIGIDIADYAAFESKFEVEGKPLRTLTIGQVKNLLNNDLYQDNTYNYTNITIYNNSSFKNVWDLLFNKISTQLGEYKEVQNQLEYNKTFCQIFQFGKWVYIYYNHHLQHCIIIHKHDNNIIVDQSNLYASELEQYTKSPRYYFSATIQKWAENQYGSKNVSTIGINNGGIFASLVGQDSKEIIKINSPSLSNHTNTDIELDINGELDTFSLTTLINKINFK